MLYSFGSGVGMNFRTDKKGNIEHADVAKIIRYKLGEESVGIDGDLTKKELIELARYMSDGITEKPVDDSYNFYLEVNGLKGYRSRFTVTPVSYSGLKSSLLQTVDMTIKEIDYMNNISDKSK